MQLGVLKKFLKQRQKASPPVRHPWHLLSGKELRLVSWRVCSLQACVSLHWICMHCQRQSTNDLNDCFAWHQRFTALVARPSGSGHLWGFVCWHSLQLGQQPEGRQRSACWQKSQGREQAIPCCQWWKNEHDMKESVSVWCDIHEEWRCIAFCDESACNSKPVHSFLELRIPFCLFAADATPAHQISVVCSRCIFSAVWATAGNPTACALLTVCLNYILICTTVYRHISLYAAILLGLVAHVFVANWDHIPHFLVKIKL